MTTEEFNVRLDRITAIFEASILNIAKLEASLEAESKRWEAESKKWDERFFQLSREMLNITFSEILSSPGL